MSKIFASSTQANEDRSESFFNILNHAIPILMGVYILLNPLPLSAVNEFCFYFSVAALLLLLVFRKTPFTLWSPLTLPFLLFFLWAIFGLFFSLDFKNTLHDLRSHLLKYIIIFYLLVNYFNSPKRLEILALIAIVSATVFSVYALNVFYFIEAFPFSARLGQTFREMVTDHLGFITIFGICLSLHFLYKSKNIFYKTLLSSSLLIMSVTTLLTQSRGSLLGFLAVLVIMCFHNKKNLIFIILGISLIMLMPIKERVTSNSLKTDIRMKMNRLTIEVIKDHPIIGIGFGMQIFGNKNLVPLEKYNHNLPLKYQQDGIPVASPHNTILDIAVRTGVVGLALFLYILVISLYMLRRIIKLKKGEYFRSWAICLFACFASFMIPALFADTTFGPRVITFYTILAMITILWNISRQSKSEDSEA